MYSPHETNLLPGTTFDAARSAVSEFFNKIGLLRLFRF
ncbi:hypothetical protein GOFOIKOB_1765 [Methylobacterium tardum]|nr:hypothetical protein GOFOIKOB_1765 [Methylobacterium tardum]